MRTCARMRAFCWLSLLLCAWNMPWLDVSRHVCTDLAWQASSTCKCSPLYQPLPISNDSDRFCSILFFLSLYGCKHTNIIPFVCVLRGGMGVRGATVCVYIYAIWYTHLLADRRRTGRYSRCKECGGVHTWWWCILRLFEHTLRKTHHGEAFTQMVVLLDLDVMFGATYLIVIYICTHIYAYVYTYMHTSNNTYKYIWYSCKQWCIIVGTDKSNDFDHFAKQAPVRSEIT